MARPSKVEACMICGDLPCSCDAKPAKVKKPRDTRPPVAPEIETPRVDMHAAMKSAAEAQPHLAKMPIQFSRTTVVEVGIDQDFAAALIALDMYDMLGDEDKERFAPILNDSKLRSQLWRGRRASA